MNSSPDILIVGAGSAGVAAAVSAAREGASVVLLERYSFSGGKATGAEVGTICGLYAYSKDSSSRYVTDGFAKEFAERLQARSKTQAISNSAGLHYLPYVPFDFKRLCDDYLVEAGVEVYYHSTVCDVFAEEGEIKAIDAIVFDRKLRFVPKVVIDCSGESIVSALLNAELIEEDEYQAAAQVFTMENCAIEDEALFGMALIKAVRAGMDAGLLDSHFDRVTVVPGSLRSGAIQLKLGVPHKVGNTENKSSSLEMMSRKLIETLSFFLVKNMDAFRDAHLGAVAMEAGIRTGRRAKGNYILTEEDVLSCRKFDDAAANCAWPIEMWGQDKRVTMKYFAENDFYQVPKQCLSSAGYKNLFFAGRTISATETAIASARVIGICLQTGFTAGKMAVQQLKKNK
jgi:hypothetical protein